jgi:uncharacterized repeat protein (TIGR01451 family)
MAVVILTGSLGPITATKYGTVRDTIPGDEVKIDIRAKYTSDSRVKNVACITIDSNINGLADKGEATKCDDAYVNPVPSTPVTCVRMDIRNYTTDALIPSGSTVTTGTRIKVRGETTDNSRVRGYSINWGDGVTNSGVNNHTYTKAGTYTIVETFNYVPGSGKTGSGTGTCSRTITVVDPAAPNYTIKKYVNSDDAQDNDNAVGVDTNTAFTYSVVVANTGNVALSNVKVWDVLPAGVSYVDNTLKLDGVTVANDSPFFTTTGVNIPSIAVGASKKFTFSAKIVTRNDLEKIQKCGLLWSYHKNTAKANPSGSALGEKQDPAVIKCNFISDPAVTIEKKVNNQERDEVAVGEDFTYSLVVTNTGNVTLTDAVVTDTAPAGVTFLSTDKGSIARNVLSYTIPSLAPGASTTINIRAEATAYRAGDITNTACVNADEVSPSEQDDCDNAVITITPTPAVTIEKKVNNQERDEVAVGEDFTYSLVVTNTGNVTLTDAVVTDTAPAGVTFLSTDKGSIARNVLSYTIPSLAPGASTTINIRAEASSLPSW